jgi:hypothetical protein
MNGHAVAIPSPDRGDGVVVRSRHERTRGDLRVRSCGDTGDEADEEDSGDHGKLAPRAFVPAAQITPPAFQYVERSTTSWTGVAPRASTSTPNG